MNCESNEFFAEEHQHAVYDQDHSDNYKERVGKLPFADDEQSADDDCENSREQSDDVYLRESEARHEFEDAFHHENHAENEQNYLEEEPAAENDKHADRRRDDTVNEVAF